MLHFVGMENNLKKMRKKAGLTQAQLAEKIDVSQRYIATLESGKQSLNLKRVKQLAEVLDCTEAEVLGYEVSGAPVPVISWVSAGMFVECSSISGFKQQPDDTILFDGPAKGKFALIVQGNSMNLKAPEGSIIIVDTLDNDLIDGKLYVFSNPNTHETTFKQFKNEPGRLVPLSTDADYQPMFFSGENDNAEWHVVGRVIEIRHIL